MSQPKGRSVELATGLRYHVREWGSAKESEATVVLVHGFLDSSATWEPLARAWQTGRHLIAPDMRGHGDSDRIGAGGYYHFADYLADLDALLETLADRPVVLVGHSMGGSICSYFAGAFPERVGALVLLEGMGPPEVALAAPVRVAKWIAAWRQVREAAPRGMASVDEAAKRMQKHDPLLTDELALELAGNCTRLDGDGLVFKHDPLHLTRGPYPFQVEVAAEFWSAIACPVLALEGEASLFAHHGDEAARRYACIAVLERMSIAGAGHSMQWHQPALIAEKIEAFLVGAGV